MTSEVIRGILIPFAGTSLGAAMVFFMKTSLNEQVSRALTGFAAGVMVAASIWSLLIPSMEQSAAMGIWAFVPAVIGFWVGILFLLLLDHIIPHLHRNSDEAEGPRSHLKRTNDAGAGRGHSTTFQRVWRWALSTRDGSPAILITL